MMMMMMMIITEYTVSNRDYTNHYILNLRKFPATSIPNIFQEIPLDSQVPKNKSRRAIPIVAVPHVQIHKLESIVDTCGVLFYKRRDHVDQ